MTLKHTPGPWLIEKQRAPNGGTFWDITETDRQGHDRIAMVGPWMASRDGYIAEGNARLISAAPDLLASLQEIRIFAEDALNDTGYDRDHILSRIFDATAIIRKATGE